MPRCGGPRAVRGDLLGRLVVVGAHHDHVLEVRALADVGADPEEAVLEPRVRQDAAVGDDDVVDGALVQLRRRQVL
jgi:hypothetical protein